ncbi:LysE family translocator [Undibacterium sp.]|uniref:LysE family translocator n=1 Tax=Undibacterium sp. TaxID=1914977 RepID=UPI00374D6685
MTGNTLLTADLLFAYSAYFVGTASPGPSNLAIMSVATSAGRKAAFVFAAGVMSGSFFWAMLATLGLSTALLMVENFIVTVKLLGGLYLLWLAFKSGRSALKANKAAAPADSLPQSYRQLYVRGALLHLTNPKAILVWMSVVALASPISPISGNDGQHAVPHHMLAVVAGCLGIGTVVFGSYAALFSTAVARRLYLQLRRWLDGFLAIVFALAGYRLLSSRT